MQKRAALITGILTLAGAAAPMAAQRPVPAPIVMTITKPLPVPKARHYTAADLMARYRQLSSGTSSSSTSSTSSTSSQPAPSSTPVNFAVNEMGLWGNAPGYFATIALYKVVVLQGGGGYLVRVPPGSDASMQFSVDPSLAGKTVSFVVQFDAKAVSEPVTVNLELVPGSPTAPPRHIIGTCQVTSSVTNCAATAAYTPTGTSAQECGFTVALEPASSTEGVYLVDAAVLRVQ